MADANQSFQTHTFKRGDKVTVFSATARGRFIIEGAATIVRPVRGIDETYMVAFPDGQYERFVDPAGQADPQAYIDQLNSARPDSAA